MALFQPTNIIPSSLIGQGTIDVNDNMEISWQVNGNSAMTAFQIDFYMNDTASTYVTSTGKITTGIPTNGFYGTDRFGNPQFFTWNANEPLNVYDGAFTNGNEYKFKITQWYAAKTNVLSGKTNTTLRPEYYYHFSLDGGGYVAFYAPKLLYNTTFYYNSISQLFWYVSTNNQMIFLDFKYIPTTEPSGTNCGTMSIDPVASAEDFVMQSNFSTFITRTTPTLTINQTDSNYLNPVTLPATLTTSIGYFQAAYSQPQGDAIRWIRWQVAQANSGVVGEILVDTGDIYTPTLNFEFNGFFNGQQYAIRCFGESESGQACNSNPSNDGWVFFNINIENQKTYIGNFVATCLRKENAVQLEWSGNEILPTIIPSDYAPVITNGNVELESNSSVTWNGLNFASEWSLAYKLVIKKIATATFSGAPTQENVVESHRVTVLNAGQNYTVTYTYSAENAGEVVVSVSGATANSTVDKTNKKVTVTFPNISGGAINATVTITARIYKYAETQIFGGVVTQIDAGSTTNVISYEFVSQDNEVLVTIYGNTGQAVRLNANVSYQPTLQGSLLTVQSNNIILVAQSDDFSLNIGSEVTTFTLPQNTYSLAMVITPSTVQVFYYGTNNLISSENYAIDYSQQAINSIEIRGGTNGATVSNVTVIQGDGTNILSLYQSPSFEPTWNTTQYGLYATANFNYNLNAGLSVAEGKGFRVYRQEVGKNILTPIALLEDNIYTLKDFGITSMKAYKYYLYTYDADWNYMTSVEADDIIATNFKSYSLLVCDYDQTNDEYHVRKQYLFALNLSEGSVGNNNSPTLNKNFTPYPTRMSDTSNYKSGTLSGLIGAIYTVPALIEQIGQYKYTAKPSTLDYFDSVDLEQELYGLSVAPYQLFLRDMKGRLRMIATSAPISMETNLKQRQQSIKTSIPWVEVGDASDVTIIQTPDDYGWDNDNQVLDVQLDVDVATGELFAQYPFPYNGTKFYLTGVNNEMLTAKTALGVKPAQFELSNTAEQPNDGELSATVTVNSEDNQ